MTQKPVGPSVWAGWILLAIASPAWSQWTQTLGQRGFVPGASFDPSTIDSVNMVNGNVVMRIPITAMPLSHGGMSADITLTYNSNIFDAATHWDSAVNGNPAELVNELTFTPAGDALNGNWGYGYNYSLYLENRSGTGPPNNCVTDGMGDVIAPTGPTDNLTSSTYETYYPFRLRAIFPDGSLHVLSLWNTSYSGYNIEDTSSSSPTGWYSIDPSGYVNQNGCWMEDNNLKNLGNSVAPGPFTYYTTDGTYVRVVFSSQMSSGWMNQAWTMYFPDGRIVRGQGYNTNSISDRNGNTINITRLAGTGGSNIPCYGGSAIVNPASPVTLIQDGQGRCIQIEQASGTPDQVFFDRITQAGFGGTLLEWTLSGGWAQANFSYTYGYGTCQFGQEATCDSGNYSVCGASCQVPIPVFQSLDLPNVAGALSYQFQFGSNSAGQVTGQLTQVSLPHGLSVPGSAGASINYTFSGSNAPYGDPQDFPISQKSLSHYDPAGSGAAVIDTWSYLQPQLNSFVNTVTNPDGGKVTHYFYPRDGSAPVADFSGLTFRIDQPDGSRLEQSWANNPTPDVGGTNPFVETTIRSAGDGSNPQAAAITNNTPFDYNGNPQTITQYDWVPYTTVTGFARYNVGTVGAIKSPISTSGLPSPRRTTNNTYYVAPGAGGRMPGNTSAYWYPTAPQLLNAVTSSLVSESTVATPFYAYSEYQYDGPTSSGNLTQEWKWNNEANLSETPPTQMSSGPNSGSLTSANAIGISRTYQNGDLLTETDPLGIQKSYSYGGPCAPYPSDVYEAHNLSEQRHWQFTWDCSTGLRTAETDADNGTTTTASYDARGRQTNVTRPNSQQISTVYNDTAQTIITSKDLYATGDKALTTTQSLDDLWRVFQTVEPGDPEPIPNGVACATVTTQSFQRTVNSNTYRVTSNPFCSTSDPTMGWTLSALDRMGRVISVGHYPGATMPSPWGSNNSPTGVATNSFGATTAGSLTTTTDENQISRKLTTDSFGRLIQTIEAPSTLGYTTSYNYALDSLISVSQTGQTRTFVYSSLGHLMSATNPETRQISYTYDADGNLATRTDARGIELILAYNHLNQVVGKQYYNDSGATPWVTYTYGTTGNHCLNSSYSVGRLCWSYNNGPYTAYTYNAVGNVLSSTQAAQNNGPYYTLSYQYNLDDGVTQEIYPSGRAVSYAYNSGGRVSQVSGSYLGVNTNYAAAIEYAPHHALQSLTMGNGLVESWAFNTQLQPTSVQAGNWLTFGYSYSATSNNGNVIGATINSPGWSGASQTFAYDAVNRLNSASEGSSCSSWCQTFTYTNDGIGAFGNRSAQSTGQGVSSLTPTAFNPANNQITGPGSWVYDNAGNLIQDNGPDSFIFDAENRQIYYCYNATTSQCSPSSASMHYIYDGDGKRVQTVSSNGTTTSFIYDIQGQVAAEYSSATETLPCGNGTCYVTVDALGSSRMVTDQSGNCMWRQDYLPFGQPILSTSRGSCYGGTPIRPQFTGKERDSESGNDFFLARYYSGAQGRFTGPDAPQIDQDGGDPQSWNLYAYGRNNPLRYVDPDGRSVTICPTGGACFVLGDADYPSYYAGSGIALPQLHIGDPHYEIDVGQIFCAGGVACGTVFYKRDQQMGMQDATAEIANGLIGTKGALGLAKAALTVGTFVFGMAKSEQPIARGFLELLQTAVKDTTGQPARTGGFAQATKDFESLEGTAQARGPIQLKELPDGSKVVLRSFSKDGRPTLEYQPPGGGSKTVWIRYDP